MNKLPPLALLPALATPVGAPHCVHGSIEPPGLVESGCTDWRLENLLRNPIFCGKVDGKKNGYFSGFVKWVILFTCSNYWGFITIPTIVLEQPESWGWKRRWWIVPSSVLCQQKKQKTCGTWTLTQCSNASNAMRPLDVLRKFDIAHPYPYPFLLAPWQNNLAEWGRGHLI